MQLRSRGTVARIYLRRKRGFQRGRAIDSACSGALPPRFFDAMSSAPDPLLPESPAPARRRRSGRRRARRQKERSRTRGLRARWLLILIFCALRLADLLYYFGFQAAIDRADKSRLLGAIVAGVIWTTALLMGVWLRRDWCRYVLMIFLGLAVAGALIAIPSVLPMLASHNAVAILGAGTLINAAIAWLLAWSPDIKRLTNRTFD
jgi:hypothetical protein